MYLLNIKRIISLLILIISMASCSEINDSSLVSEIKGSVDSLKEIHAPDARIKLWKVEVKNDDKGIVIFGDVETVAAQMDLHNLKSDYPKLTIDIRLLPENPSGFTGYALVNNSVSTIRAEKRHGAEIVNQALLGSPIKVYKRQGGWSLIQTPNQYIGWMNNSDFVLMDSLGLKEYQSGEKIVFNKQYGFSYEKPDINSQVVSDLAVGCILMVIGSENTFYKVSYPDHRIAFLKKEEVINFDVLVDRKPIENELVETAKRFNGIPYLWGGSSSKAIDCSGFTSMVYFLNGIILQRDASQQTNYGKEITTNFSSDNLRAGDLLFFGRRASDSLPEKVTHTAIYIGNGDFIHSSGKVRISSMDSTNVNFDPDYAPGFVRAMRIIGQENENTVQRISDNTFYKLIKSN